MVKTLEKRGQLAPRVTRELTPLEEMDRLFDRLLEGGPMLPFEWRWPEWMGLRRMEGWLPRVDVIEREEEILVRAEIPGVKKEGLELSLTDTVLTLKGHTLEKKEETGEFFRSEIHQGEFLRTVALPCEVVPDQARARFEDGLLEVTLPKAERTPRHAIKIE